jgi:hypothetical protein
MFSYPQDRRPITPSLSLEVLGLEVLADQMAARQLHPGKTGVKAPGRRGTVNSG